MDALALTRDARDVGKLILYRIQLCSYNRRNHLFGWKRAGQPFSKVWDVITKGSKTT